MCWWVPDIPSPLRSTGHVNNTRVTSNTKRHIDSNVSSTGLPQHSVSLLPTHQSSTHIGIFIRIVQHSQLHINTTFWMSPVEFKFRNQKKWPVLKSLFKDVYSHLTNTATQKLYCPLSLSLFIFISQAPNKHNNKPRDLRLQQCLR